MIIENRKDTIPTYTGAFYVRSKDRKNFMMFLGEKDIYHFGGTHGCVNMPSEITPYVYDTLHVGDRVFIKE